MIGAHFDHLGYGGPHSGSLDINSREIHNGADDNASGVAGMLELASKLSLNRDKLNRSIIFVGFNAEEQGIYGSKHFINNPPVPKDKIITMINLDMIGRLRNLSLNISGTGTSPYFNEILDKTSSIHMLNIKKNPEGFGPSDHASFYSNNIPVLSFFTETNKLITFGRISAFIANLLLFFILGSRWIVAGYFPLSNLYESLIFLSSFS